MSAPRYVDVTLPTGRIRGEAFPGHVRHRGIPYAADPVGVLRFAPPAPPIPWENVRDTTRPAATAQRCRFDPDPAIPEPLVPGTDSLHVDVWAPTDPVPPDAGGRPVLVWIHGGGWEAGSPGQPWFDGSTFTREGIVVVSVGYRLGVDGFLRLPDAPDNRGFLDWIAALEWVRDNIAAFGGDPSRVTVAGQSAGAGAVLALLASPLAEGLFHAAIAESPAWIHERRRPSIVAAWRRRRGPAAGLSARRLSSLTPDEIDGIHRGIRRRHPFDLRFRPRVDPATIPAEAPAAIAAGRSASVPLLIGCTSQEFRRLVDSLPPVPLLATAVLVLRTQGLSWRGILGYLLPSGGSSVRDGLGRAAADAFIRSTVVRVAEGRAARGAPTWVYEFRWEGSIGADHCTDIPFFWDALEAEGVRRFLRADPPPGLAESMHASWVRFIRSHDPGDPPYALPGRPVRVWDGTPSVEADGMSDVRMRWVG